MSDQQQPPSNLELFFKHLEGRAGGLLIAALVLYGVNSFAKDFFLNTSKQIDKLSENILKLDTTVTKFVTTLEAHEKRLDKLEERIERKK